MGLTFVFLIMAILYLPILLLVYLSFGNGLDYYTQLFTNQHYMQAVGNTLLIAVVSSLIATIIATMAATGIIYMGKKTRAITMAVNQLPVINADIVTSFGLVLLFVGVGLTNFGLLKLLLAHVLISLPFCLLTILPKMRQLDANLIDAALDLGASPFRAFTSVIVPQLVPAMVQGFLLGFTLSLDDFVITQYNNSGVPTISTVVYGAISRRDIPNAFKALTTIIFLIILIVLIIMNFNAARLRKGIKINRKVVAIILAVVLLVGCGGVIPVIVNNLTPRDLVLKIYNWEEYINTVDTDDDVDLLADFTAYYRDELKKQGVKDADKFRVEYHTFTDNEELYSKINAQHADYDIIFPSEYMVEKMSTPENRLIKPIDMTRIEADFDANIMSRTRNYTSVYYNATTQEYSNAADPEATILENQAWGIPYMVGTVGIMYDRDVIDDVCKNLTDPTIKAEIFDNYESSLDWFEAQLKQYGFGVLFGAGNTQIFKSKITMKKSARDSIGIAMIYSQQDKTDVTASAYNQQFTADDTYDNTMLWNILNMDGYDISLARTALMQQIRDMDPFYENDNGKKSFAEHEGRFAYGLYWSCDAGLTIAANTGLIYETDDNGELVYTTDDNGNQVLIPVWETDEDGNIIYEPDAAGNQIPVQLVDNLQNLKFYAPQGTNLWTDNFAMPIYGQNEDAAYAFINFMLDPENAAVNIDWVGSQMVTVGDAITELRAEYGVPEVGDTDVDLFDFDTNYACTVFPYAETIEYAAIMKNFDATKEKQVNNLMLDVQKTASELKENAEGSVNWFLIAIIVLAAGAFGYWAIYKLTHRRPRSIPSNLAK